MREEQRASGIVLFAHGSSVEEANQGVHELARQVQALGTYNYVRAAFLELAHPDLAEAVKQAVGAGIQRVVIVPYFLTMGIHLRRDLPSLTAPLRQKYPQLAIDVGQSLEGHPLVTSIILDRVREVVEATKSVR
jgi:sirohydrochlorin ferrochelatase